MRKVASNCSICHTLYCLASESLPLVQFQKNGTTHLKQSTRKGFISPPVVLYRIACKAQIKCTDIDKITMLQVTKFFKIPPKNYGSEIPDLPNFGQKAMDYGLRLKLWIRRLF